MRTTVDVVAVVEGAHHAMNIESVDRLGVLI